MKCSCAIILLLIIVLACNKQVADTTIPINELPFVTYRIAKGKHYANNDSTTLITTNYKQLQFICKFDSSAIYTTILPENQLDINKLYGFADNGMDHQKFSARIGWNWLNNNLHLWAYNYNNAKVESKDLGIVAIGKEITCSIEVQSSSYIFIIDGKTTIMPRAAATPTANGYKLFPYFGGNESAPHDVTILIKELQ